MNNGMLLLAAAHGRFATRGDRCRHQWRGRTLESTWLAAGLMGAMMLLPMPPAHAQRSRAPQPAPRPASEWIGCAPIGQPLIKIPEVRSQNGKLQGTIVLRDDQQQRLAFKQPSGSNNCAPQLVRNFVALNAVLPGYQGAAPPGYGGVPPVPPNQTADPVPGPTLRARVGDIVELTFLNQVDPNHYGDSIDRGERGQGCDETSAPYPGHDVFPDCFHGSSTGNIHFHGIHTNPGTTGDNVFVEVRPSLRDSGQPIVTEASVKGPFEDFFSVCEAELRNNVLSQWPRSWSDLPAAWTSRQEALLKAYDSNPAIANKLWPVNEAQLKAGAWPQYYIGAYPYCFRLPRYVAPLPAQSAHPASHTAGAAGMPAMDQSRALQMGQSPGTHWYHAHKHGSTAINVANGMTGAFIIEGPYDDALNQYYGSGWTRTQPVMVLNQLGVSPNLERAPFPPPPFLPHQDISVNGRLQPKLTMQPGEVQLWRIVNTSSRSGVFIVGFESSSDPNGSAWAWKQIAQDGVQFYGVNYQSSTNPQLLIAPGNRVDLLVKAPAIPLGQPYTLKIQQKISQFLNPADAGPNGTLLSVDLLSVDVVEVSGSPVPTEFIPEDQLNASFPTFLHDISDKEVKATKTVVFDSAPGPGGGPPLTMHTIDGHKFDGNVGEVVLLNTVEEWKIVNTTLRNAATGAIDHPFHIHINPFQVVEVFDPNQTVLVNGNPVAKYVPNNPPPYPEQCYLNPQDDSTWTDCHNPPPDPACYLNPQDDSAWKNCHKPRIWWDVFPIPSGTVVNGVNIPGYFKMRSRFVDYAGQYVMHCHILAHEDRGMMTIVEVVPFATAYSHQ
jgi:FtsP/CotA-like multicopper oxidase with cupredoxin domain